LAAFPVWFRDALGAFGQRGGSAILLIAKSYGSDGALTILGLVPNITRTGSVRHGTMLRTTYAREAAELD
jgi:hypothetical protein